MTIVNTQTGEITESMDKAAARRITDRIRLLAEGVAEQVEKMAGLINDARIGSAWLALGYQSWTAYVAEEFGGVLPRLDREPRQEFVRELAAQGMSSRSIAPVVGSSDRQVRRDMEAGGTDVPPQQKLAELTPGDFAGPLTPQAEVTERPQLRATTETPRVDTPRPAVTGLDGKTYARSEPKPKLVLTGSDAEYDNAEKASKSLSNAIAKLLEFQHPNMRHAMCRYWSMASNEVPPTPRRDVTPEQMRVAAQGLLALADEWSKK